MNSTIERIQALQQLLTTNQLDGFLIPHNDPHNNEYLPEYWDRRSWLSGFDGSNGDLLVLKDHIILWTDSRYTLQAKQQLDGLDVTIIEQKQSITQEVAQWLLENGEPYTIGIDPQTINLKNADLLSDVLTAIGSQLAPMPSLVDQLTQDKSKLYTTTPYALTSYPGLTATEKLAWLREQMNESDIDAFAINTLDDIAWLFNIRGKDIPCCPVCISYAFITPTKAQWFVHQEAIDQALKAYCQTQHIDLQPYQDFQQALNNYQGILGLDDTQASWWMALEAKQAEIETFTNPIVLKKACKTKQEIAGMANAHITDALALIEFMQWLETNWQQGVTEWDAAQHLDQLRLKAAENQGLSFDTISGFASNGAVVHYRVQQQTAKTIDDNSLYLVDSGGQYTTGTTDVTRVLHLGTPTTQQKRDYTLVLKGHIDLAKTHFPKGTKGAALDALARQYLWNNALNFGHGTGHGVGYFLNVHEAPCRISPFGNVPLQPGMVLSNEPGLYREGEYGIRIENLQAVMPSEQNAFGGFYQFQTLTHVPYALHLIEPALLDDAQLQWLNDYHQKVYKSLSAHCSTELMRWLKQATEPLLRA
jgi:Xaa-Pro aminopeptidase